MSLGQIGEDIACRFLQQKGFSILKRNYHSRFGEIDIVAKEKETIIFVEVKTRQNTEFGMPLEAINYHKLRKIVKTSQFFLNQFRLSDVDYRFDAIEVLFENGKPKVSHVENITL